MGTKDEEVKALYWLYNKRFPRARKYGEAIDTYQVSEAAQLGDEGSHLSHDITSQLDDKGVFERVDDSANRNQLDALHAVSDQRQHFDTIASDHRAAPGISNYETMSQDDLQRDQTFALMKRLNELKEQKMRNSIKMKEMQDRHDDMQRITDTVSQRSELRSVDLQAEQPQTMPQVSDRDRLNSASDNYDVDNNQSVDQSSAKVEPQHTQSKKNLKTANTVEVHDQNERHEEHKADF